MKNKIEVKVSQANRDPANMSRAGFWTWTEALLAKEKTPLKPSPEIRSEVKPMAIDRLTPPR